MEILGVLGGMGPQATIRFCDLLIQTSIHTHGIQKNADFPHILIDNIPVSDLVVNKDDEEQTVQTVTDEAARLAKAGATLIVLVCNTMHLYQDRIERASGVPFLSMVDAVIDQVKSDKRKKVGLVGSITTMRSGLYAEPLKKAGIDVTLPSEADQAQIGALIHAVIADHVSAEDWKRLRDIIEGLIADGAEAVILACTELPLIANDFKDLPLYDSLNILAKAVCKAILKKS